MNMDERLTQYFHEKRKHIEPPPHLKQKVLAKIDECDRRSKVKKRIIAFCLAISFIVPTSALSYTAYLANELYGSVENVLHHFSSATTDSYLLLQTKLLQAKGELSKDDFQTFMEQLKVMASLKIDYGDPYGNIAIDSIPEQKALEYKQALYIAQPYFDRLNGKQPLKEYLSQTEYEKYIEALLNYETILVHSRINPSKPFADDEIIRELQQSFIEARNTIEQFEQKYVQTESKYPIPTFSIDGALIDVEYGVAEAPADELLDYEAFTNILTPIQLSISKQFDVAFTETFEKLSYTIIAEADRYSLENLELPQKAGEYVIVVEGCNDQKFTSFFFVININE